MADSKENFKFDLGVKGLTKSGLISVYRYKEYHLRFPDPLEAMFRTPFKQEENERNSSETLRRRATALYVTREVYLFFFFPAMRSDRFSHDVLTSDVDYVWTTETNLKNQSSSELAKYTRLSVEGSRGLFSVIRRKIFNQSNPKRKIIVSWPLAFSLWFVVIFQSTNAVTLNGFGL